MNHTDRREFLKTSVKGAAVLGVGLSSLSLLSTAQAAANKEDVSMPGDKKPVTSEELLRKGLPQSAMSAESAYNVVLHARCSAF